MSVDSSFLSWWQNLQCVHFELNFDLLLRRKQFDSWMLKVLQEPARASTPSVLILKVEMLDCLCFGWNCCLFTVSLRNETKWVQIKVKKEKMETATLEWHHSSRFYGFIKWCHFRVPPQCCLSPAELPKLKLQNPEVVPQRAADVCKAFYVWNPNTVKFQIVRCILVVQRAEHSIFIFQH